MDRAYEYFNSGNYSEAKVLFEKAITANPGVKTNYWHLGLCYLLQGELEEAKITWRQTIENKSQNSLIAEDLSEFLRITATYFSYELSRYDISTLILEVGIGILPENTDLLGDLACIYRSISKYSESIEVAKTYFRLAKDLSNKIFANHLMIYSYLTLGNEWNEIFNLAESQKELIQTLITSNPHNLDCQSINRLLVSTAFLPYLKDDAVKNRTLQNDLTKLCQSNLKSLQISQIKTKEKKRIKIGYLSHCLRKHSIGWLSRWLFQYHDQDKFSIHAFSLLDKQRGVDPIRELIVSYCDQFHILGYDAEIIAQQIKDNEIDILVDLDSITLDLNCQVISLKPAPIQITWLGFDASGIPAVDYFMADSYVLPKNAQDYYSEKIWRLPNSYIAVDGFEVLYPTLHRNQINIPEDSIVYLSAQVGYKRHPETVRLQLQIIKSVPNSFLLIKGLSGQESVQGFFMEIAKEEGVSSDRLRFLPQVGSEAEHRANLGIADVVLDTYPYNGATSTLETLWMCIPLVTRVGQQFSARNSYTMMMNVPITEGIAWTNEEYVEWGIKLGTDENLRKQVSWKLKESRKTSPLWNAKQFTRDMEDAYQQMWNIYLKENNDNYNSKTGFYV